MDNRSVKVIAAIVLLAVAGFLLARQFRAGGPSGIEGDAFERDVICESCGEVFVTPVPIGAEMPVKCPKCGDKTVYIAVRCAHCGEIYPYKPATEGPTAGQPTCPHCNAHATLPVLLDHENPVGGE